MRDTSLCAYQMIKKSGLLSKKRFEVYKALHKLKKATAGELFKHIGKGKIFKGDVCSRLSELRNLGTVKEVGTRQCKVTGHQAIVWTPTGKIPHKLPKKAKVNAAVYPLDALKNGHICVGINFHDKDQVVKVLKKHFKVVEIPNDNGDAFYSEG